MTRIRLALITAILALPVTVAAQDFTVTPLNPVRIGKVGEQIKVKTLVTNTSDQTIKMRVDREEDIPDTWTSSICFGIFCLADFVSSAEQDWSPGETDTLSTWINAITGEGYGLVTYNITQRDTNGQVVGDTFVQKYLGITDGLDVLVVDQGDGTAAGEIVSRLPAGKTYGVWSVFGAGPQFDDMTPFETVFWVAEDEEDPITEGNRASIEQYLGDGGKLFLSGSNIANGLCNPSSVNYSEDACDFFANRLGASYVGTSNIDSDVAGVVGDGLGRDLVFTVDDAASDRIAPTIGGKAFLKWGGGNAAGIRRADAMERAIYLPFDFGAINESDTMDELVDRALAFFEDETAPQLSVGVLQHPFFTSNVDFFIGSADGVESESVALTVNDDPVTLTLIDAEAGIWHARHTLAAPGAVNLAAFAKDVSGNGGDIARTFTASKANAQAFSAVSADQKFTIAIDAGHFENDDYVLVISEEGNAAVSSARAATHGASIADDRNRSRAGNARGIRWLAENGSLKTENRAYAVLPERVFTREAAHVTFHSATDSEEGHGANAVITQDQRELATWFDAAQDEYTASSSALGTFEIVAKDRPVAIPVDPSFLALGGNSPNPFNPTTTIRFELRARQFVSLVIYDAAGRAVRTLVRGETGPGDHGVVWDGENDSGQSVSSGVYFARIEADGSSETRKMMLVR